MDGNNRWAKAHNVSTAQGHQAGADNIRAVLSALQKQGVSYMTIFAFSTENWNRPKKEISDLITIVSRTIDKQIDALHKAGVRLQHIGDITQLPKTLQIKINNAVEKTQNNTNITLCIAFNYGGRQDIIHAAKTIAQQNIPPDSITEQSFTQLLYTKNIPDPDIIIRTGGYARISNFLLWQSAYSELFFTTTLWPDLNQQEIQSIIKTYTQTKRNFGGR